MTPRIIRTGADWITPPARTTVWQRERRDGPFATMRRVAAASPEPWWQVLALWLALLATIPLLALLIWSVS